MEGGRSPFLGVGRFPSCSVVPEAWVLARGLLQEPALILPSSPAHLGPMPPPVSSGPPAVSRHVAAKAL